MAFSVAFAVAFCYACSPLKDSVFAKYLHSPTGGGEKLSRPGDLRRSGVVMLLGPATTQNLVVKFDGEICGGVLVENASDDFPQQKLENLLPNFTGSSPPISPKTSPTSLWKSLVLSNALETTKNEIALWSCGGSEGVCRRYAATRKDEGHCEDWELTFPDPSPFHLPLIFGVQPSSNIQD